MVDPVLSLSIRGVSLIALLLCVSVVASFRFAPGARWAEYVGIFYHLAVFLLVFKLPAPEWAKVSGYGWLLLDVAAGTLRRPGRARHRPACTSRGAHFCRDLDCHGVAAGLACGEAGRFASRGDPFRLFLCFALCAESMAKSGGDSHISLAHDSCMAEWRPTSLGPPLSSQISCLKVSFALE
jgi:hypothetical protein